jgi:glyoxylase-like metal-dependent hydrolase (beta-lactamase superfamily II)
MRRLAMPFQLIFPHVYELSLGAVNIWLVDDAGRLALIDTGYENSETKIISAVEKLGKKAADIRDILITHCHPDHIGSLAALKKITGAEIWVHSADAGVVRGEASLQHAHISPGLVNQILFKLFIRNVSPKSPVSVVDHEFEGEMVLPVAGKIRAVHTPGHSLGHTAFFVPAEGGALLVGDACSNVLGLDYSIVYDDIAEGRRSLGKLAQMETKVIAFSHGNALKESAVTKFKKKWGS